jgi:polysaccharide export outer membrane protein
MTPHLFANPIRLLRPLIGACSLILVTACQTPYTPAFPPQTSNPSVLVPGDMIKLTFSGAPDLDQSQKIRPDGKIALPLIGEVNASGKSFAVFEQELEDKYKDQLKNSEVVISLDGSTSRSIILDGAVRNPGNIPCDRPLTAFEAIMLGGGFAPDADLRKVQVIRFVGGADRSMILDMRDAMRGAPAPAVSVQAGDIIFVPEKMF